VQISAVGPFFGEGGGGKGNAELGMM